MDRQKALQILGLKENCSENQIKKKYKVLLTKNKTGQDVNIDNVTDAYNFILGYEQYEKLDKNSKSYKIRKYLFNYLSYIIIFLGIAGFIAWLIVPKLTEVEPDLSITYVGNYYLLEAEEMETLIYDGIDGIENLVVEIIYLDNQASDAEYDKAGRVRLAGTIISKQADIFIEDDDNFVFLLSDNVLMPLDDIIPILDIEIDPKRFIYGIDSTDGQKKIFGIDVSRNNLIIKTAFGDINKIYSIAKESEHFDVVLKATNILLKEGE